MTKKLKRRKHWKRFNDKGNYKAGLFHDKWTDISKKQGRNQDLFHNKWDKYKLKD